MTCAIIIHESGEMTDVLRGAMRDTLRMSADEVMCLTNFGAIADSPSDAFLLKSCQVVVAGFSAPDSELHSVPLEGNRAGALAFFQRVMQHKPGLPFVFIDRESEAAVPAGLSAAPNVRILRSEGIHTSLPLALAALVRKQKSPASARPRPLDVDIVLKHGVCRWAIPRGMHSSGIENARAVPIDDAALESLLDKSRLVADFATYGPEPAERHIKLLAQVGYGIYELLMADNLKSGLELAIMANNQQLGSSGTTRFRFHLDSETNELLVEALAKPADTKAVQYWMRNAPIMRRFEVHGGRPPLFKDELTRDGTINCLVILGRHDGFSARPPVASEFSELALARTEVAELGDYLATNRAGFRLGELCVMRPEDCPAGSYGQEVRKALAQPDWHLIHYAGHSAIAADDGKAYLVLGDGAADLLDIDTFAHAAEQARFVFLNSCSSANAPFIAGLAERGIPAVAGYAWPVCDKHAYAFSRKFYHELFEGVDSSRFLEYAFMRSKAHLYDAYPDKLAWAAPLLFMQSTENDRNRVQ
jgi:hypothetical protein